MSSFSSGPRPYWVKYRAGRDQSIKPGIHAKCESEAEAKVQVVKAHEFFDMAYGAPGAAKIGIVIQESEMEKFRKLNEIDDGLGDADLDTMLESGPLECVPFLKEVLVDFHGYEIEDAEALILKHAKLIARLVAKEPMSLKAGKEIVKAVIAAEDKPEGEADDLKSALEAMKAENKRLIEQLALRDRHKLDAGQKVSQTEEEGVPA